MLNRSNFSSRYLNGRGRWFDTINHIQFIKTNIQAKINCAVNSKINIRVEITTTTQRLKALYFSFPVTHQYQFSLFLTDSAKIQILS